MSGINLLRSGTFALCLIALTLDGAIGLTSIAGAHDRDNQSAGGSSATEEAPAAQQPRGRRRGLLAFKLRLTPNWFGDNTKFWYRNDLARGQKEFVLVDAMQGTRALAFDHDKLAAALSTVLENEATGSRLPFDELAYTEDEHGIRIRTEGAIWECNLETYECRRIGDAPRDGDNDRRERGDRTGAEIPTNPASDEERIARLESAWPDGLQGEFLETEAPFVAPNTDLAFVETMNASMTPADVVPQRQGRGQTGRRGRSPNGKWVAFVRDFNVYVRQADAEQDDNSDGESNATAEEIRLSSDGTAGNEYRFFSWSPDSKTLASFRTEPGQRLEVHFVESSPEEGGRAVLHSRPYALPGDKFTAYELNLFDVSSGTQIKPEVDRVDFGFPRLRWSDDGASLTYRKIDRGHQRLRVIRVDAATGEARNIIDEQSETFIWTAHGGWPYVNELDDSNEVLYASEQDGWRHLYLYDATTGQLKQQVTKGEWVVRGVDEVDEEKRQIWFRASGMNAEQDPYFIHYCRVNFDGTGLVELTAGDGTHSVSYSPDKKYLVDTYSRIDAAPVHELRRASDGGLILELERADVSALEESGWRSPEVFSAKGRDGETDIWGLIHRPRDFDPQKKYPIIEYIYAGPHDSHVPKSFSPATRFTNLTRLGFIVVQIDGMGTANRSKAFHDVCWHNLKDAGFPDRIAWIKAAAEKYPYMDAERVGIYGTSAGGQNSTGALLFHPEFYKAAVSACGCHDNRMDKASWNEQWMGYPVGPHYGESSNIDNAGNLVGHLLLIVGEMDTNVPPESTFRLVDALIKANKDFDLLVIPGGGHTNGGRYGTRRLEDFFVRHLQGIDPPNRNADQLAQGDVSQARVFQPVAFATQAQEDQTHTNAQEAQTQDAGQEDAAQDAEVEPLDLTPFLEAASEMKAVAERFAADRGNLERFYSIKMSPLRRHRMERFYGEWLAALAQLETAEFSVEAREDFANLQRRIQGELQTLANEAAQQAAVQPFVNFAPAIVQLAEARQRKEDVDSRAAAGLLNRLTQHVSAMREHVEQLAVQNADDADSETNELGAQAADAVLQLRQTLAFWHDFHNAYDPLFTWWMREPYAALVSELQSYAETLRDAPVQSEAFDPATLPSFAEGIAPHSELVAGLEPSVPNLLAIISQPQSEMQGVIEEYRSSGRRGRGRGFGGAQQSDSSERESRLRRWLSALDELDFEKLSRDGQVDYLMFANSLRNDLRSIEDAKKIQETVARLAPFADAANKLAPQGRGRRGGSQQAPSRKFADDETAGDIFAQLCLTFPQVQEAAEEALAPPTGSPQALDVAAATQVVRAIERMRSAMQTWRENRATEETELPEELTSHFDKANEAIEKYAALWNKRSSGADSDDPDGIVGQPIGKTALERELRAEMIAYSPEELIEIAYAELENCHDELRKASRELGYGDDWHRAVEHVKNMHVPPGEQPGMIRDLAWEAIDYMRDNDLLTVPVVAAETWRMEMMSPQRQLVSPFFLGGESIIVSYPTDGMAHDDKLQSMRGNNVPFARATVQHELIPGHHLQGFMSRRYHPYRNMFNTPFFVEGWALYWELVLYERGFPRTPEERIGMLVWRSHRCARIIFSLSYHMGLMNPQECIDFLVENVGFERNNSTAEVRRSFGGGYGPLYQAAYLLGGIQLRELRKELVESGKMAEKAFHDAILKNSHMPIDMVRASLTDVPLYPGYETTWRFHPLKP